MYGQIIDLRTQVLMLETIILTDIILSDELQKDLKNKLMNKEILNRYKKRFYEEYSEYSPVVKNSITKKED